MERPPTITNEIYHIYNRGVEKRDIFLSDRNRLRFIYNMHEFNNILPAINSGLRFNEVGLQFKEKEKLVDILAFCLMPNHFHLMMRQLVDGGITNFMRKLGTGFTNYFNIKYERVGPLFQGKYKISLIKDNAHFIHLPFYIHLNPLDLFEPEWKNGKIKDFKKAFNILNNYRWSSHLDYLGKENFSFILQKETLNEFFGTPDFYRKEITEWLKEINLESIKSVIIEE